MLRDDSYGWRCNGALTWWQGQVNLHRLVETIKKGKSEMEEGTKSVTIGEVLC